MEAQQEIHSCRVTLRNGLEVFARFDQDGDGKLDRSELWRHWEATPVLRILCRLHNLELQTVNAVITYDSRMPDKV